MKTKIPKNLRASPRAQRKHLIKILRNMIEELEQQESEKAS